ncbi:twin transmembrane helix small protein [Dokdonella sp.]|uniref:twin transmembrane helix small protein n=1 Tax=Dokdonella sp. TaxID=2291710 RepID=UPI00262F804F|nr:twin transmembrane helix small protein [Dokdonella sp.]
MLSKILILLFLAAIIYNLGAGLYFMVTDRSGSDRVLKALTRRIGLSVLLILLVLLAIATGLIKPHGVGG